MTAPMTNPIPVQGLSDERLAEIAKGCEGVTPGPWTHDGENAAYQKAGVLLNTSTNNLAYLARLDPQTVLSLVTELQHSRAAEVGGDLKSIKDCVEAIEYIAHNDIKADGMKSIHEFCSVALHAVGRVSASPASPSATGVRVKDIDWQRYERGTGEYAYTILGTYTAGHYGDNARWFAPEDSDGREVDGNIDAAKAAAQADYEARILSAVAQP